MVRPKDLAKVRAHAEAIFTLNTPTLTTYTIRPTAMGSIALAVAFDEEWNAYLEGASGDADLAEGVDTEGK